MRALKVDRFLDRFRGAKSFGRCNRVFVRDGRYADKMLCKVLNPSGQDPPELGGRLEVGLAERDEILSQRYVDRQYGLPHIKRRPDARL